MKRYNGSTIGKDREWLAYEKTAILAELEHNAVAGHLEPCDVQQLRAQLRRINHQLQTWGC